MFVAGDHVSTSSLNGALGSGIVTGEAVINSFFLDAGTHRHINVPMPGTVLSFTGELRHALSTGGIRCPRGGGGSAWRHSFIDKTMSGVEPGYTKVSTGSTEERLWQCGASNRYNTLFKKGTQISEPTVSRVLAYIAL